MPIELLSLQFVLPRFAMVMFRITGLTLSSPLLGTRATPVRLKVGFSLVVAMMLFPVVSPLLPATVSWAQVLGAVAGELMIGFVIGMATDLIFLGVRLAGVVVGQQAGIALGQVVNPMLDGQTTILGQVFYLVTLMVFFAVGGHRVMVGALLDSYRSIPPATARMDGSFAPLVVELLSGAFVLGIRLAAPALVALFIASLTMGFVARTIPQLNVLTVGFAVRVFIGLSVAAISLSLSYDLLFDHIDHVLTAIRLALGLAG